MADPVTIGAMTAISMGASVGSGIMSYLGAGISADAQSKQALYQAGVAKLNKKIAQQNIQHAIETGEKKSVIQGMKDRFQLGKIITSQAASGIDINSGSNAAVQTSQQQISRMNQTQIRENAQREAYGYKIQGASAGASANLYQAQSAYALQAGEFNQMASLISTAGSVSSKWIQAGQAGMLGPTTRPSAPTGLDPALDLYYQ